MLVLPSMPKSKEVLSSSSASDSDSEAETKVGPSVFFIYHQIPLSWPLLCPYSFRTVTLKCNILWCNKTYRLPVPNITISHRLRGRRQLKWRNPLKNRRVEKAPSRAALLRVITTPVTTCFRFNSSFLIYKHSQTGVTNAKEVYTVWRV